MSFMSRKLVKLFQKAKKVKGPVIRATVFVQLVAEQWRKFFARIKPPSCAANFNHVGKIKSYIFFSRNKKLLRKKVVTRATNHLNLQLNIVARQVA